MMKGFGANEDPLKLLEEREAIHLLLPQTTSEKIHKNYAAFTINPSTRYPNLSGLVPLGEVTSLYDTGTGPIKSTRRMQPVVTTAEKRPTFLGEVAHRKRSKDDLMIRDRSEVVPNPKDILKKPRVVDALTDQVKHKDTPTDTPTAKSPSKSKLRNAKPEGRSFFCPALKPKPTITSSNDSHVHKITHKKKSSKQFPMDDSVVLLSHTKVTDEKSKSKNLHNKTVEHKEEPTASLFKPNLPSSSHTVSATASSYSPSHSRDRSPPCNEVNVLKMKASFEKRDLEARNSASPRQHLSRHATVGSSKSSAAKVAKSASFSDLKDTQLADAAAFPSSKPQPVENHRSAHLSSGKDHVEEVPTKNSKSSKDVKQQGSPKQTEKSSIMKWLKKPHKQVAAMVAHLMSGGSYSPKDETDNRNNDDVQGSFNVSPEEDGKSVAQSDIPPTDRASLTPVSSPDKETSPVSSSDQETMLDTSRDDEPEKQDDSVEPTAFTTKELPPTEDQVIIPDNNDVRVQPLIARLEPSMVSLSYIITVMMLFCCRRIALKVIKSLTEAQRCQ